MTAVGVVILVMGCALPAYLQNVAINVGTSLVLFAGLAFAEGRILRAVRRVLFFDAQGRIRELLAERAKIDSVAAEADETREVMIRNTLTRVGDYVLGAGFSQDRPAPGQRGLTFCHHGAQVRWEIRYDAALLEQVITHRGEKFAHEQVVLPDKAALPDLRKRLAIFERKTGDIAMALLRFLETR
ncbi:hypothetical protein [Saccharopolyspora antimicrobica]|uniref:hypothetical protein n=1 Tax=Saccharopolyspora antimicrobica TaxID=455193 RepID=UPI000B8300AB|nr:hypothetical protein [Saccharopolyspora antimicrobica]